MLREFFGNGSIYGMQLIPNSIYEMGYMNMGLMVLAPGAFIILGLIVWAQRIIGKVDQE